MGCYDMVVGHFVCPYCGEVQRVVLDQTKSGECNFKDFGLEDCLPGYYEDNIWKGEYTCNKCNNTFRYEVGIQNGCMTYIKIIDTVFNESRIYRSKKECQPEEYSEKDLKEFVHLNNATIKTKLKNLRKKIKG